MASPHEPLPRDLRPPEHATRPNSPDGCRRAAPRNPPPRWTCEMASPYEKKAAARSGSHRSSFLRFLCLVSDWSCQMSRVEVSRDILLCYPTFRPIPKHCGRRTGANLRRERGIILMLTIWILDP